MYFLYLSIFSYSTNTEIQGKKFELVLALTICWSSVNTQTVMFSAVSLFPEQLGHTTKSISNLEFSYFTLLHQKLIQLKLSCEFPPESSSNSDSTR